MSEEDPLNYSNPGFNSIICTGLRRKELTLWLASNYFKIDLGRVNQIYHYELKLEYIDKTDIYSKLISRFSHYEAGQIMRDLFKAVLKIDRDGGDPTILSNGCIENAIFDNYKNVYSPLEFISREIDVGVFKDYIEPLLWEKLLTENDEITFKLEYKTRISANPANAAFIEVLHLLINQCVFDDKSNFVLQNKNFGIDEMETNFYTNEIYNKARLPDDVGVNDARIAKAGFLKNIEVHNRDRLFLQISPKIELFYPQTTLSLYLKKKFRLKEEQELADKLEPIHVREELEFQLSGLKLRDRFTDRVILFNKFSKRRAEKTKIQVDGKKMSVIEFCKQNHKASGNGRFYCVVSNNDSYHLMEHLLILDNQRCESGDDPIEKQNENRVCIQNYPEFTKSLKNCTLIADSTPYLDAFGMSISTKCMNVPGRLILPPKIKYTNDIFVELDPNSLVPWQNEKFTLFKTVGPLKLAVVDWDVFETENKRAAFLNTLNAFGKKIKLEKAFYRTKTSSFLLANEIENTIKEMSSYDVLIFVVNTDKYKDFRLLLKFHELGSKSITVYVSANDAKLKNLEPVMTKIMHKINARVGGINFEVMLNDKYSTSLHNAISERWIPKQFIGVNWRQLDNFLMAGSVAYTVNSSCLVRGSYFYEKFGSEISSRFDDALLDAVSDFYNENQCAPEEVFVYLQITREDHVKEMLQSLKNTCQGVANKFKAKHQHSSPLTFVFITIQMDSGDALFLSSGQPTGKWDLGVGTCLDREIVDDRSFLLIQSRINHASAIVLPSRYTIYDERPESFSKEQIEYFTFYLCAIHPVDCKTSEFPLPLRAASDFTLRASNNLKALKLVMSDEDYEPQSKRSRISTMPDPFEEGLDTGEYLSRLNTTLKPPTKNYFCA